MYQKIQKLWLWLWLGTKHNDGQLSRCKFMAGTIYIENKQFNGELGGLEDVQSIGWKCHSACWMVPLSHREMNILSGLCLLCLLPNSVIDTLALLSPGAKLPWIWVSQRFLISLLGEPWGAQLPAGISLWNQLCSVVLLLLPSPSPSCWVNLFLSS